MPRGGRGRGRGRGPMPRITLEPQERAILVSWLTEPDGYMELYSLTHLQTAREAWQLSGLTLGNFDLLAWKRSNVLGWEYRPSSGIITPATQDNAEEMASVWWVVFRWDGNNIPPPQMPAEFPQWLTLYGEWKRTIDDCEFDGRLAARAGGTVNMYDETGAFTGTVDSAQHLLDQRSMVTKAQNA